MSHTATQTPHVGSAPPKLEAGQERRHMIANPNEDTPEAIERAKRTYSWGHFTVGKPWRVKQWWMFTINANALEAARAAVAR